MTTIPGGNSQVDWSPDGTQVAMSQFDLSTRFTSIHIVNADGTNPVELLPSFTTVTDMAWSPDGEQLVVRIGDPDQTPFQGGYFLIVVDVATGDYRYLTDDSVNPILPSWSPDGTRLAYFTLHGGTGLYDLNVMDMAEGTVTLAAERVLHCDAPVWRS